jgi:NADP-dependent 3-hydroxy acid dehydrogenase YdfG
MAKAPTIITGRVAAITGAGRGIGRETARAFVREGMKVAIGDLDVEAAMATAAELGDRAIALQVDVTRHESVEAFLDAAEKQLGPLDVVVNNAGIMQLGWFTDEDDATAQRMIDINLHGVIFGTKAALARMEPRNHGHIVNIASQAGVYGTPGGATYSATKHAVVGLTEAVRGEMRLRGINVRLSYVLPAVVNTELGSGLQRNPGIKQLEPSDVAEAIVDALRNGTVDVWVPKSVKGLTRVAGLLPRRVAERFSRAIKADRVLAQVDEGARAAYELRASRSEPGLEPGDPVPELTESK